jgi:hypothetical protein
MRPSVSTVTSSDCSRHCQANRVLNAACLRIYKVLIDLFISLRRYIQHTVADSFGTSVDQVQRQLALSYGRFEALECRLTVVVISGVLAFRHKTHCKGPFR